MPRRTLRILLAAGAMLLWLLPDVRTAAGATLPARSVDIKRLPRIRPDYSGIVIPPNIAPLNFLVLEPGTEYCVWLHGGTGEGIGLVSRHPAIVLPPRSWAKLLKGNRGADITLEIYVKTPDGNWLHYSPIQNTVAQEEIDSHLVYRLLGPVCNWSSEMGIYQRDLESYDESPLLLSDDVGRRCINCHRFQNNRPGLLSLEVRSDSGPGIALVQSNKATWIKTESPATSKPPGHLYWHPTAPLAAFSMNKPNQVFRGAGTEIRDAFDVRSEIAVMNMETGGASSPASEATGTWLDTFPCWSADGSSLYFCRARALWPPGTGPLPEQISQIKYDLMRAAFDGKSGRWGEPETVLSAAQTGQSIAEPRTSPDGCYLLFCLLDYGMFPLFRTNADLYLMDLKSGRYRRLDCNSSASEAWHSWSSNSRWFVFSSKRDNGLLARPYFCYLDANGKEHKPFILPQKDPAFYDAWLKTYNVPELVTGPVAISREALAKAILSGVARRP